MKKIIIIISIFIYSITNTFAADYTLNWKDRLIINKLSSKIKKSIKIEKNEYKSNIEKKITDFQKKYNKTDNVYGIFEEIKKSINIRDIDQEYIEYYNKYNIDYVTIKNSWLNWQNNERSTLWISPYSYDDKLIKTAVEWSDIQKNLGISTHKRNSWDSYYNYNKIEKWFGDRWVVCEKNWGITSSESIWKNSYYCNDNDCTDEIIWWMKKIFNMYMKEKSLKYPNNPHYRWMTNSYLSKMWLWISIKETKKKNYFNFYITTHYCTKLK